MTTTSKHPPETGHKHPPSTREQRGLALFHEGAVSEHGDLFTVRGAGRNYTVSLVNGEPRCDCPDFKARREVCKHGYSVVVHAAKKNARCQCQRTVHPTRTTTERPARRHGMPRDDRAGDGRGSGPAQERSIAPRRSYVLDPARVRANVSQMGD